MPYRWTRRWKDRGSRGACRTYSKRRCARKITKDGVPYSSQNTRISYVVEGITITEGIVASGVDEPVKDGTFTIHIPENRLGCGAYRYTITVTDGDNVVTTSDYFTVCPVTVPIPEWHPHDE